MKFWCKIVALFALFVCVIFTLFKLKVNQAGGYTEPLIVEITQGTSSQKAADILYEHNIISSPLVFRLLLKYDRADGKIRAGEYLFEPQLSMQQVLDKLLKGDVVYHRVTIPEGYTVGQALFMLSMVDNLSGEFDSLPDEGSLLPETYTYSKGKQRMSLVEEAKSAMSRKLKEIWDARDEDLPYQSMKEMLIMASIIEKETGVSDERAKVASVFINRLRKGMLLQTDPTVIYALTEGKQELGRPLSRKDLQVDSPYNTYNHEGLPPTAICNPGVACLMAAIQPEHHNYYYYVAKPDGSHIFSRTLDEHNRAVADVAAGKYD